MHKLFCSYLLHFLNLPRFSLIVGTFSVNCISLLSTLVLSLSAEYVEALKEITIQIQRCVHTYEC